MMLNSTIFTIVCVTFGALIIMTAVFDVVSTVLHPEVESVLSNRYQKLLWRCLCLFDSVVSRLFRWRVLNWGLPLMVAGLIALWLVLLLVGFALVYLPWIGDRAVFASNNPAQGNLATALYYSGVTVATLGYGDIQPVSQVFRALSVLEALLGFVTVSFSVTYVLSIYPTLTRRRQIATALDAEVAGKAGALPMVQRYLGPHGSWNDQLAERLRELGMELLEMTESHEQHSVLYYAHPRRAQHSFLRMLVIARSLVGLLRYGLSPERHDDIVFHPNLILLEQSLHYSLRRLNTSLHIPPAEQPDENHASKQFSREYAELCASLERIGLASTRYSQRSVPVLVGSRIELPSPENEQQHHSENSAVTSDHDGSVIDPATELDSASPLGAYITFRIEIDPQIAAYARASGYSLEDAERDYSTTWWVGNNGQTR